MPDAPAVHVPPPAHCATLANLVARDGGTFTPDTAGSDTPHQITYPFPAHATAEVTAYLRTHATATRPAQFTARLPAARIYGSGAVLSATGDLLARDVSGDLGKPFDRHWLLDFPKIRPPEPLPGTTAVAAVNLGGGYCHWLLEEWPRLLRLATGTTENLIAHATAPFARAALALRSGPERIVPVRRTAHWQTGPLLVSSLADSPGAPSPATVRLLQTWAHDHGLGHAAPAHGERIYLSREKARRRRVTNEPALWAELSAQGFAKVILEDLPWPEQIATLRAARIVVAPHGAGLANLVFCAPGTRVIELVGRDYFNPVFWRLASLAGLDYQAIPSPGDSPLREDPSAGSADPTADLPALRAALR
jgi:capsular polysaccharide biosynthesis protein